MTPQCDLANIQTVSFGVGRDNTPDDTFVLVPADAGVQGALKEMAIATWDAMQRQEESGKYEPSEKHARIEFLHLPTNDPLATPLHDLHHAVNLAADTGALDDSDNIFAYFAHFTDGTGRRMTALRRASQFKGILKCQNRLLRLIDDSLRVVPGNVFKLDIDFDLLIDDQNVLILRPSGFEAAGNLQAAILAAVPANIRNLTTDIAFVDFGGIETYATTRARAARYIASIRSQTNNNAITLDRLCELCRRTGVQVQNVNGRVQVAQGHEMAFLELLDRRRYDVALTELEPEQYRAASRSRIGG